VVGVPVTVVVMAEALAPVMVLVPAQIGKK